MNNLLICQYANEKLTINNGQWTASVDCGLWTIDLTNN